MVKNWLFIIFFLPLCAIGQSASPTLEELIDSALHKDYGLIDQQLEISLTQTDQQQLKEAYLPRVDFTAKDAFILSSFGIKSPAISIPQLNIDIKEGHNRFTTTGNLVTADIGAHMLLYSGGKVPQLKRALAAKERGQTALLEKDRQEIISDVVTAFDQLALLRQVRAVLDESTRRLAENMKTADKALGYGLITPYEHQKIAVAQAQLQAKVVAYDGKHELLLTRLFQLTNISRERLATIMVPLKVLPAITAQTGIEDRAEIKALDAAIVANQYKIKAANTWFVPKVQLASSLGYIGLLAGHISSSDPLLPGGSKLSSSLPNFNVLPMYNIGIGLKWDLFDGKEGRREVQRATIELKKTVNNKNEVIEKLELNQEKCRTEYIVAEAQLQLSQSQQETAYNALKQATSEYRTGLIKSGQLIDAEEDYEQAALGYIQAIYDQRRAAISLLKASGHLTIQSLQ
ncbi:TolC family protein [Chitinophaga sp.]|uniref:TolC family protein n=1 Tax=Chitinophaga sp. TaxID=1869181 RepID=UPI0031DAD149